MPSRSANHLGTVFSVGFLLAILAGGLTAGCKESTNVMPVSAFLGAPPSTSAAGTGTGATTTTASGTTTVATVTTTVTTSTTGRGFDLSGSVADTSQVALSGAVVTLNGWADVASGSTQIQVSRTETANSLTNGLFYFKGVNPGSYYFSVSLEDYHPYSTYVRIDSNGNLSSTLDFRLQRRTYLLRGTALSSGGESGSGIDGALVTLETLATPAVELGRTTTSGSGEFVLSGVLSGTFRLRCTKPGIRESFMVVTVAPGGGTVPETITISARQSNFLLAGTIKDQSSLTPITNAEVVLHDVQGAILASTVTTLEGRFFLENLGAGLYYLVASAASYEMKRNAIQILESGGQSPADPVLFLSRITGSVSVATIRGTINDAYSKSPLEYVTCVIPGVGNVLTDASGSFIIPNIPPGDYKINFTKNSYDSLEVGVQVRSATDTSPPMPLQYELIYTQETNRGSIAGRFTDELDPRRPGIEGLTVRVYRIRDIRNVNNFYKEIWSFEDVELVGGAGGNQPQPVKSTTTNSDDPGTVSFDERGTFSINHLEPTAVNLRYYVFVARNDAYLTVRRNTDPNLFGGIGAYLFDATANAPNLVNGFAGWYAIEVAPNRTTYLSNYDRENL